MHVVMKGPPVSERGPSEPKIPDGEGEGEI